MSNLKVLAITKRTAELCGTQAFVYGLGFGLITATSLDAARSVLRSVPVIGVILCKHSWTDDERESIAADLERNHPDVSIIVRCPGCTGCDEASKTPGILSDTLPLTALLASPALRSKPRVARNGA